MAITAAIKINGSSTSVDNLTISSLVTLTNNNNTGVTSWTWSFISKPPVSSATIANASTSIATFIPDVVGSYLISLVVSDGSTTATDRKIGAVKTTNLGIRIPTTNEETEMDSTNGWGAALYSAFTILDADNSSRPPNGTASGDLSGSYPLPTVSKIQGRSISTHMPDDGKVLVWNSSANMWSPQTQDAYMIQMRNVSSSTPTDGYALTWNTSNNQYESKGVLYVTLKSPDNSLFRINVDNSGNLTTTKIS